MVVPRPRTQGVPVVTTTGATEDRPRGAEASLATPLQRLWRLCRQSRLRSGPAAQPYFAEASCLPRITHSEAPVCRCTGSASRSSRAREQPHAPKISPPDTPHRLLHGRRAPVRSGRAPLVRRPAGYCAGREPSRRPRALHRRHPSARPADPRRLRATGHRAAARRGWTSSSSEPCRPRRSSA